MSSSKNFFFINRDSETRLYMSSISSHTDILVNHTLCYNVLDDWDKE